MTDRRFVWLDPLPCRLPAVQEGQAGFRDAEGRVFDGPSLTLLFPKACLPGKAGDLPKCHLILRVWASKY